jgi:hypothetical protein
MILLAMVVVCFVVDGDDAGGDRLHKEMQESEK